MTGVRTADKPAQRLRRRRRVRAKVRGTAERPRLSVFRSNKGVQVQLVDDVAGQTLAAASWTEPDLRELDRGEQARRAGELLVKRPTDRGEHRALHGLTRTLIANMVSGVTDGYEKRLEIQGVGYRVALRGKALELSVGYSHTVPIEPPEGIEYEVPQPTQIVVRGVDKQAVGEAAARIRKVRPPEPYKGKGIRYADEYVMRKVGKRA